MASENQVARSEDLVSIARIVKPKGLRGELVAELLTDFPERFENLETVLVVGPATREMKLEGFYFHKNRIIVKLESVDSIDEAELFRGLDLCIHESEAVDLEDDEYFDWQLEGCSVVDLEGKTIGRVKELFRAGENVNLVVIEGEREIMIPFVEAICTEIDIEGKKIVVDLPEGLLEF